LRLLPGAVACIAVALVLRSTMGWVRPEWSLVVLSGVVSYAAFLSVVLAMGLDDDDRVIARAVLARFRK